MSHEQVPVDRGPDKKKSRKETAKPEPTLKDDLAFLQKRFSERITDVDNRLERHRIAERNLESSLSADEQNVLAKGLGEKTAFPIHEEMGDELQAERESQVRNRDILNWGVQEMTSGGVPDATFVRLMNTQAQDIGLEIGGMKRKLAEVQAKRSAGEKIPKSERIALNNLPAEIIGMEGRLDRIKRLAESVENARKRVSEGAEVRKMAEEDDTERRTRVKGLINKMGGYKKSDDRYEA